MTNLHLSYLSPQVRNGVPHNETQSSLELHSNIKFNDKHVLPIDNRLEWTTYLLGVGEETSVAHNHGFISFPPTCTFSTSTTDLISKVFKEDITSQNTYKSNKAT